MAKKIREQDIFQGDIFANIKSSADSYMNSLNALQVELKEMLSINKQLLEQSNKEKKTTEQLQKKNQAIQNITKANKGLNEIEVQKLKTEQELEKLAQQREKTEQQRQKTRVQNRKEEERLAKIKARNLKLAKQENSTYAMQSKKLNELRKRYKDLAVQNKQNSKEGTRLLKTIQKLDTRLKKVDKSVGQSQRNVGNYTSAWGKLGMRLKSVASAFGLVGGVMGAVSVIKGAFRVVVDFDSAIANLGAISNASSEDMIALTKNAKALGESTKFTATEVAGLSVELAKLGFSSQEILDSTESILSLASATGTELADASFIAGSTLRAFNLEATEMDRVASVLGVSTTKSALNMQYLGTAMSKVAPVSSALGFSIEDTTALLGTLANAGFDASTSATATRNILLNLADSSGDLANALGRPVKNLDDLVPALAELEAKGIDIAQALELTNVRSVSAFKTFINNTGTLTDLRDSITDVNSELAEMSEKQLDTISGQLALLNSKWQGMILGTSESAGAVEKIKNAIKFLTENLEDILVTIGKVIKWFVIYKTTMIATNLVIGISRGLMVAYRITMVAMNRGLRSATKSMRLFNVATKSNPLGLIIGALTTAIALLWEFSSATDEGTESVDNLTKAYEKLADAQSKAFKEIETTTNQNLANIDLEIAKAEQRGATEKELSDLKSKRIDAELEALNEKLGLAEENLSLSYEERDAVYGRLQTSNEILRQQKQQNSLFSKNKNDNIELLDTRIDAQKDEYNGAVRFSKTQEDLVADLKKQILLKETQNQTAKLGLKINLEGNKDSKKSLKTLRDINIYEKERNKLLKERRTINEELRKTELDAEINLIDKKIEEELRLRNEQAKDFDFVEKQGIDTLENYQELLDQKQQLENKQIAESTEFAIKQEEKNQELFLQTIKKAVDDKKLTQQQANDLILKSEKNLELEIDLLRNKENEQYRKVQEDKVKTYKDANQEIIETTNETIENEQSTNEKILKTDKDILSKRLSAYREFTNQIIQLIDKQTDAKIDAINKELSESEKREDELRQLAIKGTATANQSLASEQKRQAELERQRAELEKKKLRRQAILSGLDLLSNKLENDEPDAVTSTIRDITSLIGILSTLPAFAEGTDFVERGNAPKGKDKIIARIDEGERIMTKDQNKKLSGISNEQLTNIAQSYKSGSFNDVNYIQPKVKELNQPYQSNQMILEKFDSLQKTIEQKPMLTEVRWDSISKMIIEKVETKNRIDNNHKSSKGIF